MMMMMMIDLSVLPQVIAAECNRCSRPSEC